MTAAEEKASTPPDDMSPEERIAWLRERGVQISTSEERKLGKVANAMHEADAIPTDVSFVLVPADSSRPLQQLTVQAFRGEDVFVNHLKQAFADDEPVDISLLQQQTGQSHLLGSSADGTSALPAVSDETLRKVASEASVEAFPLTHPDPSNQFTGVNIYLDEAGMLKRLPLNTRASQYAERAGFSPAPTFYGDVFLGRVQRRPAERLCNRPFILGVDTALDAPWISTAATANLTRQMEQNHMTGRTDQSQPSMAGTDGKSKQESGYEWTQTEEELEVSVVLPVGLDKKDIKVSFRPQLLQLKCKGTELLAIKMFERCDVDAGTWTLDRSGSDVKVVVTMEKVEQALWPRIED